MSIYRCNNYIETIKNDEIYSCLKGKKIVNKLRFDNYIKESIYYLMNKKFMSGKKRNER
jgi:hypothetical protein